MMNLRCSLITLLLCASSASAQNKDPIAGLSTFMSQRNVIQASTSNIAQDTSESIQVNLKVIRGIGSDEEGNGTPAEIDPRIKDLSPKLQQLHFREFKLVSSQDRTLPMAKKQVVTIGDGESLTVRPVYIDAHRVGMWLRWLDADGKQILDTRMHFNCGEPMLAGTDKSSGASTILAITVHPR